MQRSVWIGFDRREAHAYAVTRHSIVAHLNTPIPIIPLIMSDLQDSGVYTRETIRKDGLLYDVVSEHPMATEFAISRFLVPWLVQSRSPKVRGSRWAVFMDSDMLVRADIDSLFRLGSAQYAAMVVKHDFRPAESTKMDGQVQSMYARKNWSSVILFNVDHPANEWLTPENVNVTPGRDLHRFCWLKDSEIGELPVSWNYLVGHNTKEQVEKPHNVHFTDGVPTMRGYEDVEYADEWNETLLSWARGTRR